MRLNSLIAMERARKLADLLEELGFSSSSNDEMIFERQNKDVSTITVTVKPSAELKRICEMEIRVSPVWQTHPFTKYISVRTYESFRNVVVWALELVKEPVTWQVLRSRLDWMGIVFTPTDSYFQLVKRFEQACPEFTDWEAEYLRILDVRAEYKGTVQLLMAERWLSQEMQKLKEMEQELCSTGCPEHCHMAKGFRDLYEFLKTFSHTPKFRHN